MSCSNAIYMANTTSQNVAANSTINLGSIIRRFGCGIDGGGTSVSISKPGYYQVVATITYTAPATGVAAVSLQDNGGQIPGATAADTVTTAVTEQNTMTIAGIVRSVNGADSLTLVNTGIAFTPSNVSVSVAKL